MIPIKASRCSSGETSAIRSGKAAGRAEIAAVFFCEMKSERSASTTVFTQAPLFTLAIRQRFKPPPRVA